MGVMNRGMGVKHWIFQRVSNALIVIFGVVLFITLASDLSYESLQTLFSNGMFKAYLLVTLVFACINSILAGWQIAGDYAEKFHINQSLMVAVGAVVSIIYLVVGFGLLF